MNFLEYVKENKNGMAFIDKIRDSIKGIARDGIIEEFKNVTEEDIKKLSLMIEFNFFDGITSDDSERDLKSISVDDVKFLIGSTIGFHKLCNGMEKNKRESYTEILYDVIFRLFSNIENTKGLFESSKIVEEVYEKLNMIESGDGRFHFGMFTDDELEQCISDIYKFMLKIK